MVFSRTALLVTNVRDRTNRDAEYAVRWRRDSSGVDLFRRAREVEERRGSVIARADNERYLVFFLKVVQLFSQNRKLVKGADRVGAKRQIPDLVFIGVFPKRRIQRYEELLLQQCQSVSFGRIWVWDHLKVKDSARAVVDPGKGWIQFATPADEARHEGSVIGVPVFGRNLRVAANNPAFKSRHQVGDTAVNDHNHREITFALCTTWEDWQGLMIEQSRAHGSNERHVRNRSNARDPGNGLNASNISALGRVGEAGR